MRCFGLLLLVALLGAARCQPVSGSGCPDLDGLCPELSCIERARDVDGCLLCECTLQACLQGSDCAPRESAQVCNTGVDVCEPPTACTDDNDETPCPAACFGRCEDFDPARALCDADSDCGGGSCRFDGRFCLADQGRCRGWCVVDACDQVVTLAADPRTQACFDFPDSCVPPNFGVGCR